MGTLILHARPTQGNKIIDHQGNSYTVHDVVDGQQRLTTIVIFLQAVGEAINNQGILKGLAAGIREKYLVTQDRNEQPLSKLSLNADSRDFFQNVILAPDSDIQGPKIRSHQRLKDARSYFTSYLVSPQ